MTSKLTGSDSSPADSSTSYQQKESRRLVPACKRCHSLKVRCIPVESDVHFGLCKRCEKSGSHCEYDLTNTKKRKTGEPMSASKKLKLKSLEVEQLKQKIEDQERTIRNLRGFQPESDDPALILTASEKLVKYGEEIEDLENVLKESDDQISTQFINASEERTLLTENYIEYKKIDIIKEGLLSYDECQRLVYVFAKQILPRYPFIEIPNDLIVSSLMKNDYLLFLIMIYIGLSADEQSASIPVSTHLHLESLISRSLAIEILSVGNKSLSLLRCLLLYCVWYPSPELFHHRRYHLFTLLCASMANDLGLTGRPYWFYNREDGTFQRTDKDDGLSSSYEIKSMILVIYIVMGSISLFLRRRVLFKWSEYMGQCCLLLEESNNRNYQLIGIYARLNYVMEKICVNVHSTSEQLTVLELSSTNNRMLIQEYQSQLSTIKQRINSTVQENNGDYHSLMSYLYSAQAYLHEPGIQALIRSKGQLTEDHQDIIYNTLSQLCESCVLTMEHFLELDDECITSNPLFHTSRIIYTSGMLLKVRHLSLTMIGSNKWGVFTDGAIDLMCKLIRRFESTILKYPRNHFLKKVKIVLGLFTQTCLNQWYNSYVDLSQDIRLDDPGFVNPKGFELDKLKKILSTSQPLNYPFQQVSASGGTDKFTDDVALPPLETIDEFEQQLLALNDELWTDLYFTEGNM